MAKPVVFIPGLPGSDLRDEDSGRRVFLEVPESFHPPLLERLKGPDILNLSDGVVAGLPVSEIKISGTFGSVLAFFADLKRAASLYDILRPLYPAGTFADRCAPFGWDWRRPVWDEGTQDDLAQAILALHAKHGPVVVIAHSTGGLVLRHLLEDDSHPQHAEVLAAIDHILAFGVPWAGTLKSFESLAGKRGLSGLLSPSEAREVLGRSWASFDLLPPEPEPGGDDLPVLAVLLDNGGRIPVSPLVDRRWLPGGNAFQALRVAMCQRADGTLAALGRPESFLDIADGLFPITNVVGWGFETTLLATFTPSGNRVEVEFLSDPVAAGLDPTDDGDNTVPRRSAAWLEGPNVTTFHLPIGRGTGGVQKHITLWSNEGGRNLLAHVVGGAPLEPFVYATVDRSDGVSGGDTVRLRCAANGADGRVLDGATLRLTNPSSALQPFDPALEGRLLIEVPRSDLRRVSNQLRRLEVEIRWREGAATESRRFGFFVAA
jgi:Lecithin:cholesterol acyltransferase